MELTSINAGNPGGRILGFKVLPPELFDALVQIRRMKFQLLPNYALQVIEKR